MRMLLCALAAFVAIAASARAEQIWLTMDQVRPYKLDAPASSIVVGNPAIADVSVQDNENLLLFGKAPGLTNMYIFDEAGQPTKNLVIRVRSHGNDMLTFHRGAARTTYNCTHNCETTVTVGDDVDTFSTVSTQVRNKFKQAESAAAEGQGEEFE